MTEPTYVRARKFLQEFFNDEDLTNFCFDYFPQVYRDFTEGMSKSKKVRMLVENSQQRGRFDKLLAALERERPISYPDYFTEKPILVDPEPQPPKTIERNPRQIFISHAHQDAEFAQRLAADLQANGWQTWIAHDDIRPGEKWVEAINRGLSECGVFMLVLTPDALASRWVEIEMNVAISIERRRGIRLLPLYVKHTDDMPALWGAYQWIAFDVKYEVGLGDLLNVLEPGKEATTELIQVAKAEIRETSEESVPNISPEYVSTNQMEETLSPEGEIKPSRLQTVYEKIKSMPASARYGIGFVLLVILLVVFWPDSNNEPILGPTKLAEVAVVEIEETERTNTPQPDPIPSQTPSPTPTQTIEPSPTDTLMPSSTPTEPTTTPTATATTCPIPQLRVIISSANVRNGPDTNSGVVVVAREDDLFPIIAKTSGGSWYNIQLGEGERGWISAMVGEIVVMETCNNKEVPVAATIPAAPLPTATPTLTPTNTPSPLPQLPDQPPSPPTNASPTSPPP